MTTDKLPEPCPCCGGSVAYDKRVHCQRCGIGTRPQERDKALRDWYMWLPILRGRAA